MKSIHVTAIRGALVALLVCVGRAVAEAQATVTDTTVVVLTRDRAVVVRQGRIAEVLNGANATAAARKATVLYDLGSATLIPGLIDVHVHVNSHFNAAGRLHSRNDGETPEQTLLAIAENLRRMLMSGVTTVQSMGADEDAMYRSAIERGLIVGPRLLTTLDPISDARLAPDSLRALVRKRKADGADAIKIFASRSIRDGGGTTMSADQLGALCGEAKSLGLRTVVHAHSEESIRLTVLAGCTQIEHGIFSTPAVLGLMRERQTFFSPQCGLIFRNYLENRAKYEGIGNFNEEGFASMQRAIPMAANVINQTYQSRVQVVWGTDAVAGAHGRQVEDLICRVREGGAPAGAVLESATRTAARSLGLDKEIGAVAKGFRADLVGVIGDPSADIEALRNVVFVMRDGKVYRFDGVIPAR